eukprot:scaffold149934_cov42-Attheya_sp.AAC.1
MGWLFRCCNGVEGVVVSFVVGKLFGQWVRAKDWAARRKSLPLPCKKMSFIMDTLAGGAMTDLNRPISNNPTVANT